MTAAIGFGQRFAVQRTGGNAAFDLMGAALPAGVTFARSTTARFFNNGGVLSAAAVDSARFDHDPATLALRGLLVEPAATNTMINSEDITTSAVVNGSWTANDRAAPDGTTTADRFTASATGSRFQRFTSLTQGVQQTSSLWLFSASAVSGNMVMFDSGTGAGPGATQAFSLAANTWTRVSVTGTPSGTDRRVWIEFATGTPTVWAWGWQTEAGAVATSNISTTSASVTRAADVLTLEWAALGVPDGAATLRYSFDNGTSQDMAATIAGGTTTVPTSLNRRWLRRVERI